jgi:segregation and condensation protein B
VPDNHHDNHHDHDRDAPHVDGATQDDRTGPVEGTPPSALALDDARRAIEAICMVSSDPVPVGQLAQLLELSPETVTSLCRDVARSYRDERRGFLFVEVAGGWRYQSHPDQAPYIERYVLEGQSARLSPAALETLAIVAYKQPLSRAQVSAIRGVNVDGVLRTLVNRGYVAEVGRDAGPGQAVLYGTTELFLEKLGLADLHQLPPLGDFVPGAHVVEALEQTLRAGPEAAPTDTDTVTDTVTGGAGDDGATATDAAPDATAVDDAGGGTDPGSAAAGDGGP